MLGTIRWKIILYSVVPVTLLYNLIFCIYFYLTYEEITADIEARIHNEVIVFSRAIDSEVRNISHLASILIKNYERTVEGCEEPGFIIGKELLLNPLISSASLYKINHDDGDIMGWGYFLKESETLEWAGSLGEADTIRKLLKQQGEYLKSNIWTNLYQDPLTGIQIISFLRPLMIEQHVWGYIGLDINMDELMKKVLARDAFAGKYIQISLCQFNLIDREGNYLYTEDKQALKHGFKNIQEIGDLFHIPNLGGNISQLIDGNKPASQVMIAESGVPREYWFFGAPIKATGWWLYTYFSRDKALSLGYSAIVSNAVILAISLILITICSWYASLKITQPVLALKKGMDLFTYKNKIPEISVNSSDEIGSLAESFQQLLEKLAERDKALHDARANNIGHLVQKLGGTYFYFNLDSDGCVTHVSPSVESILGYKPERFQKAFVNFINGEEGRHCFANQLNNILLYGWSETFELDFRHKKGDIKRVEIFWSNMGGAGSKYRVIEGMANDITERVSDTEKFKSLLNSGPDATIIATTEGIISLVNSRAEALFGFLRSELVNMPLQILTPEKQRLQNPLLGDLRVSSWDELCLDGVESRGVDANGRVFPVEITSNPLETHEGLLISIVVRDITSRKRIESELRFAKEEAERASMAKGMFLSNMSHELRTPLNGVLGYTQILLRDEKMPSRHRKNLRAIESSGHHLLSLINDILDLTKIESGEVELHMQPCLLKQMLQDVCNMIIERAASKGLAFELKLSDELPESIIIDEIKVRQVLLNLLSNAVKYTFAGGVCLDVSVNKSFIDFRIRDSGVGISTEDLGRVFEPFRQLHPGLEAGGTGLGLAISRWLVICMGGKLSVESEKGMGSEFIFNLPFGRSDRRDALTDTRKFSCYQKPDLNNKLSPPKILVVDDIASNRDMLADLLIGAGFKIDTACNGLEAVEAVSNTRYELVLMDIKMPVLNGRAAVQKIRKMEVGEKVPIVAVTASVSINTRQRLIDDGFNGYVSKPFDANKLFRLIEELLGMPMMESDSLSVSDYRLKLNAIGCAERKKILSVLSEALEQGDLGMLEEKVQHMNTDCTIKPISKLILGLCQDMDIEGLEKLALKLNE